MLYLGARRKEERGEEGTGKEEKKKRKRKRSSGHCSLPVDVYPKKGNAHVSSQRQPDQNDPADWSGKFREERKEEEEASRRDQEDRREKGKRKDEKHHIRATFWRQRIAIPTLRAALHSFIYFSLVQRCPADPFFFSTLVQEEERKKEEKKGQERKKRRGRQEKRRLKLACRG